MLWGQPSMYSFSQQWNWTHVTTPLWWSSEGRPQKCGKHSHQPRVVTRRSQLWHATKQPLDSFSLRSIRSSIWPSISHQRSLYHFQWFSHWLWLLVIRSSTGSLTPFFLSPEAVTLDDIAVTLGETDQRHWNRFWISDPAKSPWGDCWSTIDFTWKKLFKLLVTKFYCWIKRFLFFARSFHWCLHLDLGKMSSAWGFNQELTDRLPSLGMLDTAVGPTSWFFF